MICISVGHLLVSFSAFLMIACGVYLIRTLGESGWIIVIYGTVALFLVHTGVWN